MPDVANDARSATSVCYLLKRFPRLSQTFILNELLELERQGLAVPVVAASASGESLAHERLADLRATVRYLDGDADDDQLAAAIVETGAAHIHAHFATWGAAAALRASASTGLPYSFTAHARDIYHESVDPATLAERIANASFVVTVSDANRRYLEDLVAAQGRIGRIVRLHNGMDLTGFGLEMTARDPRLVVSVGRLVEKKGFADLIEACRLLHERGRAVQLAIVGEGELRPQLEAQIARAGLGGHVSLPGARAQRETLDLIARGTVFALPCVVATDGDRDGLPTVILEAMALGTPVVSTDLPGITEMIRDDIEGRIVPQRDPAALAAALDRLLREPERRAGYAERARARVGERFDLTTNVAELARMFAESASPHSRGEV